MPSDHDFNLTGWNVSSEDLPMHCAHPSGLYENSTSDWIEKKFIRLRDEWRAQRGPYSSSAKLAMHPAYQKIIGMGPVVIPFLLRELEIRPESWFWALNAITEANPVAEESMGDGEAMAQAWLKWGREQGYQW